MSINLKPRERADKHNVTLEKSYWSFAKRFGEGNASKGIRKALYIALVVGTKDIQESLSDGA